MSFLHHLRDVLKPKWEELSSGFPVPCWFAVCAWSKGPKNRSQLPKDIRSGWNENLGRRRKEKVIKGEASGASVFTLNDFLSETYEYRGIWD